MTTLTLTLLDGPLAGRPMPLPAGALTIGGGDADIAMTLEHGAQVALTVSDDGVRVLDAAPIWVEGEPFTAHDDDFADARILPLHKVIDLAGLALWLDDGSAPAPPSAQQRPARVAALTSPPQGTEPLHPHRRRPLAWLVVSGLSLVIAAAGVAIWRTGTATVISRPPQPDAFKTLVAHIAPGVALAATGDAVRLSGGCIDDDVRARLRAEARWQGKALRDDTWCPANSMQTVGTLLRLHGFTTAQVDVAPDGMVVIDGPLVADARWRATSDALDALALPHGWRLSAGTASSFERLVSTLRDAGQLRGIDISRDRSGWRLTGALTPGRYAALKGIVDTWNTATAPGAERHTMPVRIEPLPPPIPTLADTGFSAPLASIGGSPTSPALTLADGTRLSQGVRLPGGTRVIAIHADGVSIGAQDRLFYLPLTPEIVHDASDAA